MTSRLQQIPGYISEKMEWPDGIEIAEQEEGSISFKVADAENIYDAPAFFNPVMVINRDVAILFAKTYSDKMDTSLNVFEPLAGIGVRAFRMTKVIGENISEVVISDYNPVTTAIANVNKYGLNVEDKVHQFKREARSLAYDLTEARLRYHFVDLDPFGSPSPFIDSMWPLLQYRAMIAVTATDMTALCGVYPDACMRKYGGLPLNNHHTHETATRILIAMVAQSAGRFEKGVVPIFATSVDHYTKVFFTVRTARGAANKAVNQIGFSYTCTGCAQIFHTSLTEEAPNCCSRLEKAGPLWTGDIFDPEWCLEALSQLEGLDLPSTRKLKKLLTEGVETNGIKGFYQISTLCKNYTIPQPSFMDLMAEIEKEGYRVVRSYFTDQAIRSDIPGKELELILRRLVE